MSIERKIRVLAGSMILLSLLLGQLQSPWFLLIALFVALNLIQSAFTGFCPAEKVLRRLSALPSAGNDGDSTPHATP